MVDIYNEALAGDIEGLAKTLSETGGVQDESPPTMEVAELIEDGQVAAREQVAYMLDLAKPDALETLGEDKKPYALVERDV